MGLCVRVCVCVVCLSMTFISWPYYHRTLNTHLSTGCPIQSIYLQSVHWYISTHMESNEISSTRLCIFLYTVMSREMYLPTGCTKKCIFQRGVPRNASSYRMYQEMSLPIQGVPRNESSYKVYKKTNTWHCIQCLHVSVYWIYLHLNLSPYISYIIVHNPSSHCPTIPYSFSLITPSFIYLFIYKYICM